MWISRWSVMVASALLVAVAGWVSPANAQPGGNAGRTGDDDAWIDAILATPNQRTPVPQDNEFATAPGLEQEATTPQFTFDALAPLLTIWTPSFAAGRPTIAGRQPGHAAQLREPDVWHAAAA